MLGIAELLIAGLLVAYLFRRLRLPGLLGMLLVGLVVSPHALGWVSPAFLDSSDAFRVLALVVILLRAGLQIRRSALKQVGKSAILLAFVPGLCEAFAITFLAPLWMPLTYLEAALLGFILAAVSPAVIVPMMIDYQSRGLGMKKGIPTMVLAASAIDDAVAILIFSVLLGVYLNGQELFSGVVVGLPISLMGGVAIGVGVGYLLIQLFVNFRVRATQQMLLLMALAVILIQLEHTFLHFSPFIAIVSMGFVVLEKQESMADVLSDKLSHVWTFASVLLFVTIGAQVNVHLAWSAGWPAFVLIVCGLLVRSAVVLLTLANSVLSMRERYFVVVSFWPKATVQAAMGAVPLTMMAGLGMNTLPGEWILAVSVLSILITAPLGAIAVAFSADRCLKCYE